MKNVRTALTCCLVSSLFVLACGSKTPTAPSADIGGRWQGTIFSAADGPGTVTLELTQTGLNVTGDVRLSQDGLSDVVGTLTGTLATDVSSTSLLYTVTYAFGEQCQGTFSGTLSVTSRDLSGPYSGQNCVHAFAGALHATRF
jgi:hypothetical protein